MQQHLFPTRACLGRWPSRPQRLLACAMGCLLASVGCVHAQLNTVPTPVDSPTATDIPPEAPLAAPSLKPALPPLPPIEELYAQFPMHFLGIADFCHSDPEKRLLGAQTKARVQLARSIRVQVASELTWWRHEEHSPSTGADTYQETFCKLYVEWVDEPLPTTPFTPLAEYTDAQGKPCLQLLAVLPTQTWASRLPGYSGLRVDERIRLQQHLTASPAERARNLTLRLALPTAWTLENLPSSCLTEALP